jgi:hypothetical protein
LLEDSSSEEEYGEEYYDEDGNNIDEFDKSQA